MLSEPSKLTPPIVIAVASLSAVAAAMADATLPLMFAAGISALESPNVSKRNVKSVVIAVLNCASVKSDAVKLVDSGSVVMVALILSGKLDI